MTTNDFHTRPAGYVALIQRFGLQVIPNWHESFIATGGGTHQIHSTEPGVRETYISRYWPGEKLGDHLEFALKYDGTNLAILASIFRAMDVKEFIAYVQSKPLGKYARRLWYLYEMITDQRLPVPNLVRGSYIDLLDPAEYYTARAGGPAHKGGKAIAGVNAVAKANPRVRRQRVNDNLLGDGRFCPMVRRTDTLRQFEAMDLRRRCQQTLAAYPQGLLKRALSYLYTKETKSSFAIEHIKPDANRTERFISLLQLAEKEDFGDKPHLIDLQNRIVEPRFAAADYRKTQNYVGETVMVNRERVHFACPKPGDLPDLMAGLVAAHQRMEASGVHPVVHAAAIAYGFVFLHPFEDGNGRIHRFLIHNILARRGLTPQGLMFPVSAAMLKNPGDYDASLEAFSRPLMPLVEYALDDEGRMAVHNDTADWYRFIDVTPQAEALFAFIEKTIETELPDELAYLANYDRAKPAIQSIVDMPDRQVDLFIRFCLQNHGKLPATKRTSHFDFLSDDEVARMEHAVQDAFEKETG